MAKTLPMLRKVLRSSIALPLILLALSFAFLSSAPPVASQPVLPEAARYDCNNVLGGDAQMLSSCCVKPGWERGDADGDGTLNHCDPCPNDRNKINPGICGCGVSDANSDGDSRVDCQEECDTDPRKLLPGQCGCGNLDTDTDGDGTADCNDGCDNDPRKTAAGQCGCGIPDTDTDGDGTADCNDGCDNDRNKTVPGICGCGVSDANSDGDSRVDCQETCDTDPNKLAPGICGCGVSDINRDGDSRVDCQETCDTDPNKLAPGICGCGISDVNTDGDSRVDCQETCDTDPAKLAPGYCGCGVPEARDIYGTCCPVSARGCDNVCWSGKRYGGCDNQCGSTRTATNYWNFSHYTQGTIPGDAMNWLPGVPLSWVNPTGTRTQVFTALGLNTVGCWAGCLWHNAWVAADWDCAQRCVWEDWFLYVTDNDTGWYSTCHSTFQNRFNLWNFFWPMSVNYDSACNEVYPDGTACFRYRGSHRDGWIFNVAKMITTAVFGVIWAMFPGLGTSPVSLDWDTSLDKASNFNPAAYHAPADLKSYAAEEPSYTKFPLDPNAPDKYVLWRASDKAPLLVYDPQHTGKITKAEQLFGNFTFGKRWTHGYEPMAELDANRDGELSGDELKDLGLWFDHNRNGISEPGEVKTLSEKKVTKLFFQPKIGLSKEGMLIATKGYVRTIGAHELTGSSRDWFGAAFDKKVAKNTFTKLGFAAPTVEGTDKLQAAAEIKESKLSGVWNWKIDKPIETPVGALEPSGRLTFNETQAGIYGISDPNVPKDVDPEQIIRNAPLAGRRIAAGNEEKLQFTVQAGEQLVHSTATLLPDGTMRGVSEVEGARDKKTDEIYVVSYSWTATRSAEAKDSPAPAAEADKDALGK